MNNHRSLIRHGRVAAATLLLRLSAGAADFTPEQIEFFESKIRPVLAQECYECHNSRDKAKSGLVLDHRQALLDGGDTGPAIVPGKASESLLIEALKHEYDLEMPKAGVKLDPPIIANFEKWIDMGAPDPRDEPPTDEELAADTGWDAILETRKNWWSFQPIRPPESPVEVDAFLDARIAEVGLEKSSEAGRHTVLRRLHFVLTGLPPTPEDLARAEGETHAETVDRLLASPHFGERWARHWMDWIRYAESHGSEGDPRIDNAHLYRDYLIRALNADLPYDQLLREHVAGDLLARPRLNRELGVNESAIATAHWRMVFHGFAPTDALDEKVRFTDDQINVFTKAFQGLTVSCARCHDHKFDAISQADYYALFGILGSTRPGRKLVDLPGTLQKNKPEMAALKPKIRSALAEDWTAAAAKAPVPGEIGGLVENWERERKQWAEKKAVRESWDTLEAKERWNLAKDSDYRQWHRYGNGLPEKPSPAGEFTIAPEEAGTGAVAAILPSGVYSHALSDKHAARLTSPEFSLDGEYELHVRAAGGGQSMVRYVVQNYPRSGTVFKVTTLVPPKKKGKKPGDSGSWKWHAFDLSFWEGDDIHIELATGRDAPLLTKAADRSWFGIRDAVLVEKGTPHRFGEATREHLDPFFKAAGDSPPASRGEAEALFRRVLDDVASRWGGGEISDQEALFLDFALASGSLPNSPGALPAAAPLLASYRELESAVPVPTRVHGLDEWTGRDQPLFDRGDHKKPLDPVPRRFLDAIDPTPFDTELSGRLELAESLLGEENPFTRRVIVNRIWHHVFGSGIVSTADNFGRMGEKPSHPGLLDFLAVKFSDEFDWSIKRMIRHLVTTDAFQRSSRPGEGVAEVDPDNRLLSHFPVKRLEAEAVRDSLLLASGRLDPAMFGNPVNGGSPRRSVYVQVIRNNLDPFLGVYDAPVPFSATGRRAETNVPAQSLAMLNNDFVVGAARQFAGAVTGENDADRVRKMWLRTLAREPSGEELDAALDFLEKLRSETGRIAREKQRLDSERKKLAAARDRLTAPVRARLEADLEKKNQSEERQGPVDFGAIGHWDFSRGPEDLEGEAAVELVGSARIEDGALVVDGGGFGRTAPLGRDLEAKTLEVRVQLSDLAQKGGGAMSVQGLPGEPFDSITYAERRNRRWMAGSSGFRRTQDFGGSDETEADQQPVHLAIAYEADGTIRGYRNGVPYGKPYRAANLQGYPKGTAQVVFGIRHGKGVGGGRMLRGRILEARLYDRALGEKEIAALAAGRADFVTEREVREALSPEAKESLAAIEGDLARIGRETADQGTGLGEDEVWKNLAHSIFNLKEFIYVY